MLNQWTIFQNLVATLPTMQLSLEAIYQIRACVQIAFFFSGRKLLAVRSGVLRWSVVRWEKKQPALYDWHGALQITMFPIWHPDIRAGRMWERDCYHLSQEEDMERWHPDFWFKALGAQHKYGVLVKKDSGPDLPFSPGVLLFVSYWEQLNKDTRAMWSQALIHLVTSPENIYQVTCNFLWRHKDFILLLSHSISFPQDVRVKTM